jgi:hypothetical protein
VIPELLLRSSPECYIILERENTFSTYALFSKERKIKAICKSRVFTNLFLFGEEK